MNLSDNPRLRLLTLCALYVSQGIPFGFVTISLAAFLADQEVSVGQIGMVTAMTSLPWSFKWVWGPLIDRFGYRPMGRRRPWILLAQLMMALTIGAMIAIPDLAANTAVLAAMVFQHNVFASLQDVSTDALACDLLTERERGRANGLMYGSSYLGAFVGGTGLGLVMSLAGLRAALVVQVVLLLGIMILPLELRERAGERLLPWTRGGSTADAATAPSVSTWGILRSLVRAFSLRSTLLAAALALLVRIGVGVLGAAAVAYLIRDLGWSKQAYTNVQGVGVWLGLAGSVLGGFLADRVGPRRLAAIASSLLGLSWILFALLAPWWENRLLVSTELVLTELLFSVLSVSLFALFMGISWPVVAATQFTAYMALMNLSNTAGASLAGPLRDVFRLEQVYFGLGIFQIAALVVLLWWIDPHETRRVLGGESDAD